MQGGRYSRPTSAMVLAAGLGKRMRPLTDHLPKPMISIAGRTMIDRVLDKLVEAGVRKAIINTHYKAEMLADYIKKRQQTIDMELIISYEEVLLETGGGVAKALPYIGDEPFYAINSDIVWLDGKQPALDHLASVWDSETMDGLLLLHKVSRAIGYNGNGDFDLIGDHQLKRDNSPSFPYVFTGVQILSPKLFTDIPEGPFSLNVLYGRARQSSGVLNRIGGVEHTGDWLHIGTPEGVRLAEEFIENKDA